MPETSSWTWTEVLRITTQMTSITAARDKCNTITIIYSTHSEALQQPLQNSCHRLFVYLGQRAQLTWLQAFPWSCGLNTGPVEASSLQQLLRVRENHRQRGNSSLCHQQALMVLCNQCLNSRGISWNHVTFQKHRETNTTSSTPIIQKNALLRRERIRADEISVGWEQGLLSAD